MLRTFEDAAAVMREYFRNHPPEQTSIYKQNLRYLEPFLKTIDLDRCSSEKFCVGLPLHTLNIRVHLPVLNLVLVRLRGRLQVLMIGLVDD